jgi:hypothetical protein
MINSVGGSTAGGLCNKRGSSCRSYFNEKGHFEGCLVIRLPKLGAWGQSGNGEEKMGCSSPTNYEWSRTLRKEGVRGMEVRRLDGRLEVEMKYSSGKRQIVPPTGWLFSPLLNPPSRLQGLVLSRRSALAAGAQDHAHERKSMRATFRFDSCLLFSFIPRVSSSPIR